MLSAQNDPMRDESQHYARRLQEAGVAVWTQILPAPSAWPDALAGRAGPEPGWASAVRPVLADFFAAVTPNPVPARS